MKPSHPSLNLKLATVASLVAMVFIEVGLRFFYPIGDPHPQLRKIEIGSYIPRRHEPHFRISARAEPGLPGVTGVATFETNALGFVGPELDDTARRIFLIGGSTMEAVIVGTENNPATCLSEALSQSSTITWTVQNTAHSGDASFDHVAMLSHRILHLRPYVIVVMAGVNDLIASLRSTDYRHLHPIHVVPLKIPKLIELIMTELQVGRLVAAAFGRARFVRGSESDPVLTTHYKTTAQSCGEVDLTESLPPLDLESYARNLRSLVALGQAHGARVVFMSHPHSWRAEGSLRDWHWMMCHGGRRYPRAALADALDRYNAVTRDVAQDTGAHFIDMAVGFPVEAGLYDDVHMNEVGVEFWTTRALEAFR